MPTKDLIVPGFIGTDTIEFIPTRGMNSIDIQTIKAIIFQTNVLIGESLEEEHYLKGVAVTGFTFLLLKATNGDAVTSGTVTGKITGDGGTQGAITATPAHEGNGQWSIDLSASEMDADVIGLTFLHTDAVPAYKTLRTK